MAPVRAERNSHADIREVWTSWRSDRDVAEIAVRRGGEVKSVSSPLLIIWVTCTSAMLCALLATAFLVVREWCWNRDRRRRVAAMLQRERKTNGSAVVAHPMALQLAQIRALPEVRGRRGWLR
jgi:hypothetical protein